MSERDATNFFITILMAINRCSLALAGTLGLYNAFD